jgi:hypothetical protein
MSPSNSASMRQAFASRGYARSRAPRGVLLDASVQNGDDAAEAMTAAVWSRTSRTEFRIETGAWREDGEPIDAAISAAAEATWHPYASFFEGVVPSSRESGLAFPTARRAETEAFLAAWTSDRMVDWITPESASRWEGLVVGQP